MKTNETNIVDLFPENEEREQNRENPKNASIEELRKHVLNQIDELHSGKETMSEHERLVQLETLSAMEKKLYQELVKAKLIGQFKKWATEPLWGKKKAA